MQSFRLFLLALTLIAASSLAHHSYVAEFDGNDPATIEGVVKEVWFKNPHIRYYVTVINEDGEAVVYDTRGLAPVKLVRLGWTKKTIQVGDRVKIYGHLGHTNKRIMSIIDITLEDGRVLTSRSVAYDIKDVKE
ncbi:MAG: hypothetical protein GTN98_00465 [Woeseiaceae bacterium]|nr:hypothetical protein [Woeseiaceae bacterium]